MSPLLTFLAVVGGAAVAWRALRALLRIARFAVDRVVAGETAEARAQRGDLTGMAEASEWKREAGRLRRRAFATFAFWVVLLLAPPLTPWGALLYAAYAPLWLVHLTPFGRL
ncbi:MAG: hypothetical protein IRZ00_07260 [Gemmatimonadetes bacterium]|nr:hypothetical protein [Gemmatimonadota bacterium]